MCDRGLLYVRATAREPLLAVISWSRRPSRSMNIRSKRSKILSSWVTAIIAASCSAASLRNKSMTMPARLESSAAVGSSASKMRGLLASARAIATRCYRVLSVGNDPEAPWDAPRRGLTMTLQSRSISCKMRLLDEFARSMGHPACRSVRRHRVRPRDHLLRRTGSLRRCRCHGGRRQHRRNRPVVLVHSRLRLCPRRRWSAAAQAMGRQAVCLDCGLHDRRVRHVRPPRADGWRLRNANRRRHGATKRRLDRHCRRGPSSRIG